MSIIANPTVFRRRSPLRSIAALLVSCAFGLIPASPAGANVKWTQAIEVPGTELLNVGGNANAVVNAISCPSAGDCAAVGTYTSDDSGNTQAFVVNEVKGIWKTAIEVPGMAALNVGGFANVDAISCASAGNCSAGGSFAHNKAGDQRAFLVNEVKGKWHRAVQVPSTLALNDITTISCHSVGNCSAGGGYSVGESPTKVFVVNEVKGSWQTASLVVGLAKVNTGGNGANITSLSCGSGGNCSAGGNYTDDTQISRAFIVNETNGRWQSAMPVSGTIDYLTANDNATISSISCSSKGNCSAGGHDVGATGFQAFVVNEEKGRWKNAIEVPGMSTLNVGNAEVSSVSCSSAGNCSAGGDYASEVGGGSEEFQAFVVNEVKGSWQMAFEVPGTATLNSGSSAGISSISCFAAGECVGAGTYEERSFTTMPFATVESGGRWQSAIEIQGVTRLNTGDQGLKIQGLSCTRSGFCGAGGSYSIGSKTEAFVFGSGTGN